MISDNTDHCIRLKYLLELVQVCLFSLNHLSAPLLHVLVALSIPLLLVVLTSLIFLFSCLLMFANNSANTELTKLGLDNTALSKAK